MDQVGEQRAAECRAECPGCDAAGRGLAGDLCGWRLVVLSVGVFLVPLVLAIAAALAGGPSRLGELLGAVAGLAAGLTAIAAVGKLLRRAGRGAA